MLGYKMTCCKTQCTVKSITEDTIYDIKNKDQLYFKGYSCVLKLYIALLREVMSV